MKVAVSSTGDKLDAIVDPRFGRCAYFMIVEVENKEIKGFEAVKNEGVNAMGGAGIKASQLIANKGVEALISGNIGPNAFNVLSGTGIKVITGVGGVSIREAVESYLKGELSETSSPTASGFGPKGTGRGQGMGR
jgi:predicted Fe-Mo cluster-binding NifX family protein